MNRLLEWLFPRYVDPFEAAGVERPKPVRIHIPGFGCTDHGLMRIQAAAKRRGVDTSQLVAIAVEDFCSRDEGLATVATDE